MDKMAPGSPQLGSPKLGDFSKLGQVWSSLGTAESLHKHRRNEPTEGVVSDEEVIGPRSEKEPSPVAFIPRNFLANFDFSKLDVSGCSSPETQTVITPQPQPEESGLVTTNVARPGSTKDPLTSSPSLWSSPANGYSTAASSPEPQAPPLNDLDLAKTLIHRTVSSAATSNVAKHSGHRDRHTRSPRSGRFVIAPHLRASYAKKLAQAEAFLAANECCIKPIQRLNYSIVHRARSGHVRGFSGEEDMPWFCPIPLTPLSQLGEIGKNEFWPSPHPLLSADARSINPVYLSTNESKCKLILGRLGLELTRDALLEKPSDMGKGLHIFVDMSNIAIGFRDQLMRLRGLDTRIKTPEPPFFFGGLKLILERERAVKKRVVAGSASTPHERLTWPPHLKEAEALGYEMNILHRVIKPHTEPLKARKYARFRHSSDFWASSAANSSEDEVEAQLQLEYSVGLRKKGEQAVDEILHLKMCESIIDSEPSTMVLATGDGAVAEFSGGFVAQAERALAKGWTIELVTWKANISAAWQKLLDSGKWKKQLRVIHLDWFAEELYAGMETC